MNDDDATGLDEAYGMDKGVYTSGNTMYVAGTKSLHDAVDDLAIPFGQTNTTSRYRDAALVLQANPQIQRIVGHSLGGAVALHLGQENPDIETETYGAPVASLQGSSHRHRHWADPIAIMDWGADTSLPEQWNPHSYESLARKRRSTGDASNISRMIG